MNPRAQQPWIPLERIQTLIQLEPGLVILGLAAGAWIVYRIFLKAVSAERHSNLRKLFTNLILHMALLAGLYGLYSALSAAPDSPDFIRRLTGYIGLFCLLSGATVFIKTSRIILFEYLFFSHMKVGVPLLLVNLFTLLMSVFLGGWLISEVFNVQLAPLLATSAVFSLILGLAVQDTLGNLFAGVALQFDKPYEIGDWIEIQNAPQKWSGQVHEISWRATVLIGWSDELVTVPNRTMSQAHISNYSLKSKPIVRTQTFRLPFDCDRKVARFALIKAVSRIARVRKFPEPSVFINETTESWLPFKLVFFVDDFGSQFVIADQVIEAVLEELDHAGIALVGPRLDVTAGNLTLPRPPQPPHQV